MSEYVEWNWAGEPLWLLPERAIWMPDRRWLLLADLHLGKATHFRKAGIALPAHAGDADLEKLAALMARWQPERVIYLGDLFHSTHNADWELFGDFVVAHPEARHILVQGNHDILPVQHYRRYGITRYAESLMERPFIFSHAPMEVVPEGWFNLAGHVHPGVRLVGGGRQGLRLPCFFFGKAQGLLPAFGNLTGTAVLQPTVEDAVFVLAENKVIRMG